MFEALFFALLAIVAVVGAIGMVIAHQAVHSALFLVVTLFCVAVLYLTLSAEFLAAAQIIVYTGAIMVLFLFVITLLNPESERQMAQWRTRALIVVALGGVLLIELVVLVQSGMLASGLAQYPPPPLAPSDADNVRRIGETLFGTGYLLPFELTAVLLIIAIVGATVLARRRLVQ